MPDISDGACEAKVRRRISGEWVEGWAAASEFCPTSTAELSFGLPLTESKCLSAPCPRTEAIKTAREMKWSADELVKVLKALG